jgi:DNA-binding transcriptional regulator LsrR (DeoR family)
MRRANTALNERAEEAAYLAGELALTRAQIGERMQISPPHVSRLLARAETLGCYVKPEVRGRFISEKVTPARLKQLRSGNTQQTQLYEALLPLETETGVKVRRVHVMPVAAVSPASTIDARLEAFGREAAIPVLDLIERATVVAVTWGMTISRVIDGLKLLSRRLPHGSQRLVIPVCAESEGWVGASDSSAALAHAMNRMLNDQPEPKLTFPRVPAFVPRRIFGTQKERGVREMMWSSPAYRSVFGKPKRGWTGSVGGLVDQASLLLTSVGSADHPTGFNNTELLEAGRIKEHRLKRLIVGDIGGILIPQYGTHADLEEVRELNRMWTGLDYSRLRALAERAAKPGVGGQAQIPGVVVVSCGEGREDILEAVVRRGLVNELILDERAATSLAERLSAA